MIGSTIGPYRITEEIGAGGMGVVYRAHDSKLGRDVALKLIPEEFLADPERLARFQREAKLLASLNHPSIAGVFGLEESEGRQVIVMELVEGETLADRLQSGPLAVDEAVRIARQVATALEAAHLGGVVHRDIKPANIKVTPEGAVKVLDFGLAKATEDAVSGNVNLSQSPTITGLHPTMQGVILGTAAYMSPEQARGKPIDKRTDIWSFGCVLFECLTGKQAFAGETVTDTIARILERDPDWGALPSGVPPRLRRLLERCLAKDPSRRFRDIGDVRIELDDVASGAPDPVAAGEGGLFGRRLLAAVGAGILIGAVLTALGLGLRGGENPEPGRVTRLTMTLPPDARPNIDTDVTMAWAPDGRGIAYNGIRNGQPWIFLRDFDTETPVPIPGTQGGSIPFFSPDGKWLAFSGTDDIEKVPVDGGTPIKIHPGSAGWGATWAPDGTIISPLSLNGGLMRFPDSGGEATALTRPAEGELGHWWPSLLPDGKHVLFTCWRTTLNDASIEVVPVDGGEPRELVRNAAYGRYAASGHLIFSRGSSLMAVPFDPVRVKVEGSPVVVQDSVRVGSGDGNTMAVFGKNGTLVYYPAVSGSSRWLTWVEPGPDPEHPVVHPVTETKKSYRSLSVSPDGRHVALGIVTGTQQDIWVLDIQRGTQSRITLDGTNQSPVWSPDGREIAFSSLRRGPYEIYETTADGGGGDHLLFGIPDVDIHPSSWSSDDRLAFRRAGDTQSDVFVVDLSGDGEKPQAEEYAATEADERNPRFSPDGKWMLYASTVSGRGEVYLQSYPPSGGRLQVSVNGGGVPLWAPDGTAVYYWHANLLYRVPIAFHPRPEIGNPVAVIDGTKLPGAAKGSAIQPDGKRFIMILESRETQPLRVVQNWFQEVERLAGKGK